MDYSAALPVNHHADHPGFSGVTGALFALVFLAVGRANARLAVDAAGVTGDDRVVDIGCGPGEAVRQAARRGAAATGVDPAQAMLRTARLFSRGDTVEFKQGTAEHVPLPDGCASVVWSLATVHHWKDVGAGLREAYRLLVPTGRLLAVERQSPPAATGLASHGWTRGQAESFAAQCRSAGFEAVEVVGRTAGRRDVWVVRAKRP
ncbi:class I SAM-dependent methyltransferase [Mycobacterium sp. IDR2000157661]|uniref:class I SAM-dependent methyltransferase n=1 Tax=Mycobacterium sp. IDR2000157661 TaxID=2867005 RepID=UPI001EEAE1A2|nr:class I SAM-dependent methyltransferase [Mycobacterium sp. IDR2000157661]ULE32262.1 class I SAM-dependent methyltransferase [Mycobacterium sp. IDR2000157661]